jgi:uncharacterized protein (TIGR03067 family)
MRARVALVLAVSLLVAADKAKKGEAKKGATGIDGTWEIVSLTQNGKKNDNAKGDKVIFKGKTMTVKAGGGEHKGTFTIDAKKKTIDIVPTDGPQKGKTIKGIFQLKNGELKICFARPEKDRPKEFAAPKDSGLTLAVLKRGKSD